MENNIYNIKTLEDFKTILNKHRCVILKAGADWCEPCKKIEPFFEELINIFEKDIGIVKINIDYAIDIKRKFRIIKIPYIANFFDKEITDVINTSNKEAIRNFINKTKDKYDMLKQ